ncbi:Mechanosensitive ion channel [Yoonia tamlensis]|uniref:Mechanosensitive ion channel n=1 Tax=Yoonia tamlensis TaxID=390270 RepID=A0A1I6G2W3_9RHOB|nr:mechanosensitive ion channel domain-containing protein [Yoonia tamlensis]SFR36460.1 Mechanosensitive ion channel [Yoonia tamlensis]
MEELEKSISPFMAYIDTMADWLSGVIGNNVSLIQAVALVLTLLVAIGFHRWVRTFIASGEAKTDIKLFKQLLRTARAISLPIVWVFGLWVSLAVLGAAHQATGLLRLCASLLNAWVIIRIVSTAIPSPAVSNAFAWTAWAVAAINALGQLDPAIRWLDGIRLTSETVNISVWDIVQGALVTCVLLWTANLLVRLVQNRLEKSATLNPSMRVLTTKLLRIGLIVVAVVLGMQSVGVDLTAFAVFSGAIGLGVGLGMQRTIGNLVAGFTMLADRSIKPGDVIEIETGTGPTYGEVKTLGARYVSVKTRSGTETLIPNELLISNPVTNWTFSDKLVRRDIQVGVSYSADLELALRVAVEAAAKCGRVLKTPPPICLIRQFGDSSIDLEVRFWIADPELGVANIASEVYLEIWRTFKAHNIEIPFPQRDVHIRTGAAVSAAEQ